VFLSHSSEDREVADRLARVLRSHGVPVFYSPHAIVAAQDWQDQIGRALSRCDWFIVLLSPAAAESMWVKREVRFALTQRHFEQRIVSLHYQACDIQKVSWVLGQYQTVDFTQDFATGCRQLLRVWGLGLDEGKSF
jgi:hypothetical protein